ncbi:conserved hypothetical protein [Rubrivivax sp. A210]|uniref:DUF2169 family type VI secretion system accessory protein n=1 Tax=Rubrivivax sp. A210 TaxID=2772301 RepID=UPI0019180817|nr:DUF2169 domain-containing protein [Rubrivivax sp. A210]CAD5373641.1 conserved hypothetical protein [Rubrivivax sp. A210]
MLQVDNRTPFKAALAVFADPRGVETAYLAVKAAFDIAPEGLRPTARPVPLLPGDVYWGDPATTGLRAAGELTLCKPSTDIVVLGHAIAPQAGQRAMQASLRLGPVASTLRVWGLRRWQRRGLGQWKPSEPEPFERVPLRWELAFGGFERVPEGGEAKEFEVRNPVGRGFIGRRESGFEDRPLPQIEHPEDLLEDPGQRCAPVGWAPIAPAWAPRRHYAGTYDEAWQKTRSPFLPKDFDPRHLQTAPPALVSPSPLQGGEPVQLLGCQPAGRTLAFELPRCTLGALFRFRGGEHEVEPRLDSVILEPDAMRVQMIWRAGFAVDKHLLKLAEVRVDCDEYPRDEYLGTQMRRVA